MNQIISILSISFNKSQSLYNGPQNLICSLLTYSISYPPWSLSLGHTDFFAALQRSQIVFHLKVFHWLLPLLRKLLFPGICVVNSLTSFKFRYHLPIKCFMITGLYSDFLKITTNKTLHIWSHLFYFLSFLLSMAFTTLSHKHNLHNLDLLLSIIVPVPSGGKIQPPLGTGTSFLFFTDTFWVLGTIT